jgi:hypothetical protein
MLGQAALCSLTVCTTLMIMSRIGSTRGTTAIHLCNTGVHVFMIPEVRVIAACEQQLRRESQHGH